MKVKFGRIFYPALLAIVVAGMTGCGGEQNAEPQSVPVQSGALEEAHGTIPPVGPAVVDVPEEIKGKWKAVVLTVEDRSMGTNHDYTVDLGKTLEIPDSDLTVEVNEFFPAFLMQGSNITSASNNPENPAAKIEVKEGGTLVFDGWLFANFPTTHPFPHQRFGIILKEGIPS